MLFVGVLVVAGRGAAQIPDHAEPATSEYDATIASALSEFQAGRFPEARALFERAHVLLPNARALRGVGIAAFEMRDYPHAWVSLRASLDHPVRPLALEQREDVVALLARTELFLARIELVGVMASAHVLVDGREPIASGTAIIVGPGPHTISVEVEGMRTHTQTVESVSGTTQRVAVTLVPLVPLAPPASAVVPPPRVASRSRVPALVLLGSGAGIGVVGLTCGAVGLARARDADADARNARRLGYAGDTLMGLGLAAGVSALVWRVASRDDAPPVSAVVVGDRERAMLQVGGSF